MIRTTIGLGLALMLLAACAPARPDAVSSPSPRAAPTLSQSPAVETPEATTPAQASSDGDQTMKNPRVDDFEASVPPQVVPRDGIRPVYEPRFQRAEEAPLLDDELVLGLSLEGEAKAYPITVLRFREMVNDEMRGIPTLVTW